MADRPILFSGPMVRALLDGRKTQTRRVIKPVGSLGNGWPMYPQFINGKRAGDTSLPGCCNLTDEGAFVGNSPVCPGDKLYVREAWRVSRTMDVKSPGDLIPRMMTVLYEAGGSSGGTAPYPKDGSPRPLNEYEHFDQPEAGQMPDWAGRPRVGMHMPRWASRLTLTVTDVRVQKLQEITRADALAEGVEMETADPPFYYVPGIWPHSLTAVGVEEPGGRHAERSFAKLWNSLNTDRGFGWDANPWCVAISFTVDRRNIDEVAT